MTLVPNFGFFIQILLAFLKNFDFTTELHTYFICTRHTGSIYYIHGLNKSQCVKLIFKKSFLNTVKCFWHANMVDFSLMPNIGSKFTKVGSKNTKNCLFLYSKTPWALRCAKVSHGTFFVWKRGKVTVKTKLLLGHSNNSLKIEFYTLGVILSENPKISERSEFSKFRIWIIFDHFSWKIFELFQTIDFMRGSPRPQCARGGWGVGQRFFCSHFVSFNLQRRVIWQFNGNLISPSYSKSLKNQH